MPEYPEMQALAERLDALLGGARVEAIEPLGFSALKTVEPGPDTLVGRTLERVGRRGKWLLLELGGPRIALHLSQGGRPVIEEPPKDTRPKGGVVRLRFEDRPALLVKEFGTERRAQWWVLAEDDDGPLAGLGPEATSEGFAAWLASTDDRRRIHTMLRDQRTVAGVGRGYADDALHRARLSPFATVAKLSGEDRERLLEVLREVLAEGLEIERRREGGLPPKVGDHWIVHGRWGEPCPRCGEHLRRVSYESHDVTYCAACQTGGKVLADRRFSRIVR